jgi:hypothetical protein
MRSFSGREADHSPPTSAVRLHGIVLKFVEHRDNIFLRSLSCLFLPYRCYATAR